MIVLCAVCGVRRVRNSQNSPPHTQIERECDRIEEVEARLYQEQMRSNLPNLEKRARERDDAILSAREEFETHTQAVRIEKQIDLRLKRSQDTFAQVRTIAHTAHTPHTHLSRTSHVFSCVCVCVAPCSKWPSCNGSGTTWRTARWRRTPHAPPTQCPLWCLLCPLSRPHNDHCHVSKARK